MLIFPSDLLFNKGTQPGAPSFSVTPRVIEYAMESGITRTVKFNKEAVDTEQFVIWTDPARMRILTDFYFNQVNRVYPFWYYSQLYEKMVIARFHQGTMKKLQNVANDRSTQSATFQVELDKTRVLPYPEVNIEIPDIAQTYYWERFGTAPAAEVNKFNMPPGTYEFGLEVPLLDSQWNGTAWEHTYFIDYELNQSGTYRNAPIEVRSILNRELTADEISNISNFLPGSFTQGTTRRR